MQSKFTENLNEQQQKAVLSTEGPLLILAGAGSGKTKTITHRIAYILEKNLAGPAEILAVSFTNKASGEMRERVAALLGRPNFDRSFMPYMGTFHGICVRILRQDGEYIGTARNFVIFDESDRVALIKQLSKQLQIDEKKYPAKLIGTVISSAKNELVGHQEFTGLVNSPLQKVAAQIFPLYEKALSRHNALDFDDLIGKTVSLMSTVDDIRKKWQKQFKYILIDEY